MKTILNFRLLPQDRFLNFLFQNTPEAVQVYIDTRDLAKVFDVHASILDTYRDDFAKYATQAGLLHFQERAIRIQP